MLLPPDVEVPGSVFGRRGKEELHQARAPVLPRFRVQGLTRSFPRYRFRTDLHRIHLGTIDTSHKPSGLSGNIQRKEWAESETAKIPVQVTEARFFSVRNKTKWWEVSRKSSLEGEGVKPPVSVPGRVRVGADVGVAVVGLDGRVMNPSID